MRDSDGLPVSWIQCGLPWLFVAIWGSESLGGWMIHSFSLLISLYNSFKWVFITVFITTSLKLFSKLSDFLSPTLAQPTSFHNTSLILRRGARNSVLTPVCWGKEVRKLCDTIEQVTHTVIMPVFFALIVSRESENFFHIAYYAFNSSLKSRIWKESTQWKDLKQQISSKLELVDKTTIVLGVEAMNMRRAQIHEAISL